MKNAHDLILDTKHTNVLDSFHYQNFSYDQDKSTCVKSVGYDKDGNPKRACVGLQGRIRLYWLWMWFYSFLEKKKEVKREKTHHAMCNSRPQPSYKHLSKLSSFKASIKSSLYPTKKSVVTSALDKDEINLFHRGKDSTVCIQSNHSSEIGTIPAKLRIDWEFLSKIKKINIHVKYALEFSVYKSFLSAFVSIVREGGLPVFCFDASHSKHLEFSGRHFVLLEKLATNKFLSLCYAIVPTEDVMYITWFFMHVLKAL